MADWHPEDIKAAIRKSGTTIAALARASRLNPAALGQALTVPRSRGERIISRALGIPAAVIWPSRYHPDGKRKSPQPPANYRSEPRFAAAVNSPVGAQSRNEAIAS